jgi:hypothetical protein
MIPARHARVNLPQEARQGFVDGVLEVDSF